MAFNPADLALLLGSRVPALVDRSSGIRRRGLSHHKARLSDEQVQAMRERYARWMREDVTRSPGMRRGYRVLARIYGCSWPTVRDIVKGRTRIEAGGPLGGEDE